MTTHSALSIGATVWNTTEDKRELIFYSFSFSLSCGKLNIFLQNTWTNKDQCIISNAAYFSLIYSETELGTTILLERVKCCTLNQKKSQTNKSCNLVSCNSFKFPMDSSNKHLQLCKQNAFSNSFVKQSVPSEERTVITNTRKKQGKTKFFADACQGTHTWLHQAEGTCGTLVSVLQQLR